MSHRLGKVSRVVTMMKRGQKGGWEAITGLDMHRACKINCI